MADGTTKRIDQVGLGDQVRATDPETGETTSRTVSALHINVDTDLTDVTVTTPDCEQTTLKTTNDHPFWDATDHRWVDAADLPTGHKAPHQPTNGDGNHRPRRGQRQQSHHPHRRSGHA
jgi:hypothetical protein